MAVENLPKITLSEDDINRALLRGKTPLESTDYSWVKEMAFLQARGVLPEKFGRGVRPASQNPYPIYEQNLRFSLPYLWPDQIFDTLFMTWFLDN